MVWIKDIYTGNYICSECGNMVRDDGYGNIDCEFCPHCGQEATLTIERSEQDT